MNSPGTSKDSPADISKVPDKYGMVINDKLFRHRRKNIYANDITVYVSQKVYDAVHLIKSGMSILEVAHKHNIDKRLLLKKLEEIKRYRAATRATSTTLESKASTVKACRSLNFTQNVLTPVLPDKQSLKGIINSMSVVYSLVFPQSVKNCINELEKKIVSYEEAVVKYDFKLTHLACIIRNLKRARRKKVILGHVHADRIYDALKRMIPSYSGPSPVFNEDQLPKRKQSRTVLLKNEVLMDCIWAIHHGLTLTKAIKKFGMSHTQITRALKKLGIKKNKLKPGFAWRRSPSNTLSEAELHQILGAKGSTTLMVSSNAHRKKRSSKMPVCLFCHQLGNRDVELGKLHIINKIAVHYYCLLFSCALEQNGNDDEGILGFLPKDILKELNRGNKLKCYHCGKNGATIGCNNKYCKKTYHFPCGLDNFAQYIFTDNFSSMCVKHRRFQDGANKWEKVECPICKEDMIADPKFAVWSPCCRKSSWFHKLCLQKMALSAGYFFKCPLCNDKNTFVPEMLRQGVFVPEQDASWELEPNAFQELLERPILCDAPKCRCPSGRKSDEEGTKWEVLLCNLCGSSGIHIACGKLQSNSCEWNCAVCSEMLQESALRSKQENRVRRAKGRRKRNLTLSDDDDDEDSSAEGTPSKRCSYQSFIEGSPSSSVVSDRSFSSPLLERNVENEVFVPEGIQGGVVIAKLRQEGAPLSEALKEMEAYAENFLDKLEKSKYSSDIFLEVLNGYVASGGGDCDKHLVTTAHLRKFTACELSYDQMRLLRKSFEMCFAIQILKMKILQTNRRVSRDPFNGQKCVASRKKMNGLRKSLVNLLSKAREANLLHESNTWSDYYESLEKPLQKVSTSEEFSEPSTSKPSFSSTNEPSTSYSYSRVIVMDTLEEKCQWCNTNLCPGKQPCTIFLSTGKLEVICTSCRTCNVFNNLVPQVLFPRPSRMKNYKEPDDDFDFLETTETERDTRPSTSTCSSPSRGCKNEAVNTDGDSKKTKQSSICDFFTLKTGNLQSNPLKTNESTAEVKSDQAEESQKTIPSVRIFPRL